MASTGEREPLRERRAFDETRDASRRTYLASERTTLAWWRTGLTAFALAVAAGKVTPELTKETRWPYAVLGGGFAVFGVLCVLYGYRRDREVAAALREGRFAALDERFSLLLTLAGAALGLLTLALVVTTT